MTPTDTYKFLQHNKTRKVFKTIVFEWHDRFSHWQTDLGDNTRNVRPLYNLNNFDCIYIICGGFARLQQVFLAFVALFLVCCILFLVTVWRLKNYLCFLYVWLSFFNCMLFGFCQDTCLFYCDRMFALSVCIVMVTCFVAFE